MPRFAKKMVLAGALASALFLAGCATEEEVQHAQATADQALSSAQAAQNTATSAGGAAQSAQNTATQALEAARTAQTGVDQNRTDIASLNQQVQDLKTPKRRVAERD